MRMFFRLECSDLIHAIGTNTLLPNPHTLIKFCQMFPSFLPLSFMTWQFFEESRPIILVILSIFESVCSLRRTAFRSLVFTTEASLCSFQCVIRSWWLSLLMLIFVSGLRWYLLGFSCSLRTLLLKTGISFSIPWWIFLNQLDLNQSGSNDGSWMVTSKIPHPQPLLKPVFREMLLFANDSTLQNATPKSECLL